MKITLDKRVITLEDAKAAEEIRKEWQEYIKSDNDFLFMLARHAIKANYTKAHCNPERLLIIDNIEVTKNHYQLTVWLECMVEYNYQTIMKLSFDAMQALNYIDGDAIDCNLYEYKKQ